MNNMKNKIDRIKTKIPIIIDDSKPFIELRKYYSASDICIFPKETSLSSIHAQICGCPVIMEDYKSNIERVINKNNLFHIDNINEAAEILKRIIENNEYKKADASKKLLEDREYKKQVEKFKKRIIYNN
jgi:glycosyltransferase involved in cell wall biosynthesis